MPAPEFGKSTAHHDDAARAASLCLPLHLLTAAHRHLRFQSGPGGAGDGCQAGAAHSATPQVHSTPSQGVLSTQPGPAGERCGCTSPPGFRAGLARLLACGHEAPAPLLGTPAARLPGRALMWVGAAAARARSACGCAPLGGRRSSSLTSTCWGPCFTNVHTTSSGEQGVQPGLHTVGGPGRRQAACAFLNILRSCCCIRAAYRCESEIPSSARMP